MKTNNNTPATVNTNACNIEQVNNSNRKADKLEDFGQKIGGARKDMYQAANEWAARLADITAESLTKAGGVSKLLHLPNLESMTAAGAITAEQARAALIIWRGIERKPQGTYRADRWAERTRARLEAVAATLTATEPTAADVRDIINTAKESAEFAIITAANWPADPFTFGTYTVKRSTYSTPAVFRIIGGRYYQGTPSADAADIAAQLRTMTAADAEKAADRRAAGPRLGVYHTSDFTRYFIAVEGKCEIVLKVCNTYQEATEAARTERAALLERYEALRNFPALRRSWNRPRIGKEWHAEDVTPEQFTAALPFKGVEFGNWLNQLERAALLNSAFDGFHDLADLLGIPAAAVALGGRLNFSFATRGHAGSAAHFETCYNTINLNKRNGAGCMAHEWLHACDHYAAVLAGRGGCGSWGAAFATEYKGEAQTAADTAARRIIDIIKGMDYYTRSGKYQAISGKMQGGEAYYTMPCELAARGFEGVVLYLLTKAGACSDFLVNLESWKNFELNDAGHRRDCYPYPSDAEAAALLPYYMDFFRALFGRCEVSREASEGVAAATLQAQQEKAEADREAAEKAAKEQAESEARRAAQCEKWEQERKAREAEQERKAAEMKANAEQTRAAIVETLTARHFDTIATGCDSVAVYAVAHLEGEIYTLCADIATANKEGRAYIETLPAACLNYKRVHNAKRIICRSREIRAHYRNAAEMIREELAEHPAEVRTVANCYTRYATADNWQHAAKLWADTQRLHEEQAARHQEAAKRHEEKQAATTGSEAPAEGLQLIGTAEGVAVIGNDWKDTYFHKKEIKAHGATWNKERKQWEATDPAAIATLRAWFALRTEEQTTAPDTIPATTLQEAEDITATPLQEAAEIEEPADALPIAASMEAGAPVTESEQNRDGLPEWLHVGTRFVLIDFATGKPTKCVYTCAAIDYENRTITIPEAADAFRAGSHVYRWDAFHWPTFAPITEGEGEPAAVCHSYDTAAPNYSASETSEPCTEADNSPSWETSYTADDFHKLTTAGEIADEDRDIIGRRFVHSIGTEGDALEVFIADYAGNERHALVYSLEPLFEEVRCKVRSLDYLRKLYTPAHGWQAA